MSLPPSIASVLDRCPSASSGILEKRLLFATSRAEKDLFLSAVDLPENKPGEVAVAWCFQDGHEEVFFEKLTSFRPHAIVTGWSTSSLLRTWLETPDCPTRYICHLAGSVRNLVPRRFLEKGGHVTNWGTLAGETVAEHALLLALAALRNMTRWPELARNSITDAPPPFNNPVIRLQTQSLFRRRVGIHGFGAVARALIRLLRAFETEISVFSAGVPESLICQQGARPVGNLKELLRSNDVIFECESLTPLTERAITAEHLALIPSGGTFVNIGRARVVDEEALIAEARSQRIRVAVDVIEDEPLRPSSPWMQIKGAILSPHIGGPSADCYPQFGKFAMANIHRFLASDEHAVPAFEARVTEAIYDRST